MATFLNRAGARIEVRAAGWKCAGCRAQGRWSDTRSNTELTRQAQAHANQCSALKR
ncbi:hypothetical protein M2160_004496 [Streptomyces sp. SAI-117]|uniref:hypothetical protein n=1 Tax=Streptomyces sp. SAI-117 TaxID=2940546 RepID=UPI002475D52A|nr:hypothetical protein [Streptomyces sp. SAI-117]MDH6569475.1 hypothetical protein [Streptomyces sp. SAI-117]